MMKAFIAAAAVLAVSPALAALPVGNAAPDFEAEAALDGGQFTFKLADALKKGPVVVYFYPKANTRGCDVEAHEFSEKAGEFAAHGATVIGISSDTIETLKVYSADPETCAGKVAVASDEDGKIMRAYDTARAQAAGASGAAPQARADRTTYVIRQDGEIAFAYSDQQPLAHVAGSLDAVKALGGGNAGQP